MENTSKPVPGVPGEPSKTQGGETESSRGQQDTAAAAAPSVQTKQHVDDTERQATASAIRSCDGLTTAKTEQKKEPSSTAQKRQEKSFAVVAKSDDEKVVGDNSATGNERTRQNDSFQKSTTMSKPALVEKPAATSKQSESESLNITGGSNALEPPSVQDKSAPPKEESQKRKADTLVSSATSTPVVEKLAAASKQSGSGGQSPKTGNKALEQPFTQKEKKSAPPTTEPVEKPAASKQSGSGGQSPKTGNKALEQPSTQEEKKSAPPKAESQKRKADALGSNEPSIQMRDASTGKVVDTFPSLTAAASSSGVSEAAVEKACLEGGGYIGRRLFRYVDHSGKALVASEMPKKRKQPSKKKSAPTSVPQQQQPKKKSAPTKQNVPRHILAMPSQGGPVSPNTFDTTTLFPVKMRSKRVPVKIPKHVELVDRGSKQVICFFYNVTMAHHALGLTSDVVTQACVNGTRDPEKYGFDTYILRYSAGGGPPLGLYEYGAHKCDSKQIDETHVQRIARWKKIVAQEREERLRESPKTLPFQGAGQVAENTITISDITIPSGTITDETDTSSMCIMCQEATASIVLEPCHHCVLCASCAETGCPRFCPACRTTVTGRVQPSVIRAVRPRIFSSYSFM